MHFIKNSSKIFCAKIFFHMLLLLMVMFTCYNIVSHFAETDSGQPKKSTSPKMKARGIKNHDKGDIICLDRFGKPIRRREVILVKPSNVTRKKTYLTIGISTIKRTVDGQVINYLVKSLKMHLNNLSDKNKDEIKIVIFCADNEKEKRSWILNQMQEQFSKYIENGMIDLIYAPGRFYQTLENLPQTFRDSDKRMRWRGKQSLDYAFLAYYSYSLGQYYLQLEDDVESSSEFYNKIKQDIEATKTDNWVMRHYSRMGFIGKLIRSEFLRPLADIWRIYYFEMPLDWTYVVLYEYMKPRSREVFRKDYYKIFKHLGEKSSSKNDDVIKPTKNKNETT